MPAPKTRLVAINATGTTYTDIVATRWCRYVEIIEDDAAAAVGLVAKFADDNFTQAFTFAAAHEPIVLGSKSREGGVGRNLGLPVQTDQFGRTRPADVLCKLISKAAATSVQVREWD